MSKRVLRTWDDVRRIAVGIQFTKSIDAPMRLCVVDADGRELDVDVSADGKRISVTMPGQIADHVTATVAFSRDPTR